MNIINSSKWVLMNATKNGDEFTLSNGKISQYLSFVTDETKYRLEFNCIALVDFKSYFLMKVTALDGKHTYLIPVNFLGSNSIEFELVRDVRTIEIILIGSLEIKDIGLYENGVLTQQQKEAIDRVTKDSDKWSRIEEVTNEQGSLVSNRLEGSINNALNTIFGGNGTMEIIDGTIIFRNKATDAESTMAMRLNYGGLAIADSKKADGSWDWKTFGTGQGFTADYMTSGTLSAITIDGVTITGTDIIGGTISGVIINGATIYVGDKSKGNYIELSPNNPVKVWKNNILVSSLGYSDVGGGNLTIYDQQGAKAFAVECKEDGDLEIFGNSDSAMIPDPNHPGFWIPNPNPRKIVWRAGTVAFPYGCLKSLAVGSDASSPFWTRADVRNEISGSCLNGEIYWKIKNEIDTLKREIYNNYSQKGHSHYSYASSSHTHSEYASNSHQHTIGYADGHSHSCSSPGWSDRRLKENIEYIDPQKFMEFANSINLVAYNFIGQKDEEIGVIAQDLLEHPIGKHFVHKADNGMYYVNYEKLATTALACSKYLYNQIESINARLDRLEMGGIK